MLSLINKYKVFKEVRYYKNILTLSYPILPNNWVRWVRWVTSTYPLTAPVFIGLGKEVRKKHFFSKKKIFFF